MSEGRREYRKKRKTKEKIGYNLITKTFYYTDIMCYLHIKKLHEVVQNNDLT